jgi:hypothetical protein
MDSSSEAEMGEGPGKHIRIQNTLEAITALNSDPARQRQGGRRLVLGRVPLFWRLEKNTCQCVLIESTY